MVGSLLIALIALATLQKAPLLANPNFEDGLAGWKISGDVSLEMAHPIEGKASLELGPGAGTASQTYKVPGLRILYFGAVLKPSDREVKARIRLQCCDKHGRVLMDLTAGADAKHEAAIYLKTHAFTDHVVLSIEKEPGGTALGDKVQLSDDDRDRVEHKPEIDLDEAMHPIWEGKTISRESVLLLSSGGSAASGKLLFPPTRILSVSDEALNRSFKEGKDYAVSGNVITAIASSKIPTMSDKEFATGEFPWTRLDGRHIFVTYQHEGTWTGALPESAEANLPETFTKLRDRKPFTLVAYGDSITLGINVSGFRNVPPYQPPWPTLVGYQLGKIYHSKGVKLYNTALGGMTSQWAKDNAKDAVGSLKPDLVLIAFGMNDFWSLNGTYFRQNIEATIATIRKTCPACEFILIAPMKFDPVYTTDPTYVGNLAGYASELRKLEGPGIAVFDMTAVSDALYKAKSAKDLETDPMHPDDFLARWYAQGIVQMLTERKH